MRISSRGVASPRASWTVDYEGTPVAAVPGTTVGAALTDAGILALRETGSDERGLFCGMGVCSECLVCVDGKPGRLACMTPAADGMRVTRQPARPEPDLRARALDELPERELAPEVLVVGGGPAGLAAAAAAAEAGAEVLLVDERAKPGGQYYKQPAFDVDVTALDAQYTAGRALVARAVAAGVTLLGGVRVWGASGAHELFAAGPDARWTLRPQRLILATGAYERSVPFPGWTLPGVMTTGAGQSLVRAYQTAPGQRVLVAGNGPLNVQLAAELTRAGGRVGALVELAAVTSPRHARDLAVMATSSPQLMRDGLGYLATLARHRIPMLTRSAVVRVEGDGRAEHAVVARIDERGRPVAGTERGFDVDAVCVGLGFMPGNEIARLIGVPYEVDAATGGFVVERDATGRAAEGVWVVGDSAQVQGAKVAEAAGELAGVDAAGSLRPVAGTAQAAARTRLQRQRRFQRSLWRVYRAPRLFAQLATPQTVVCRCESVTLAAIETAIDGVGSAGALKRLSRVGMGRCQGRFCGFVVADLVADRTGHPVDRTAGFAPQPPFRPTEISVVARGD